MGGGNFSFRAREGGGVRADAEPTEPWGERRNTKEAGLAIPKRDGRPRVAKAAGKIESICPLVRLPERPAALQEHLPKALIQSETDWGEIPGGWCFSSPTFWVHRYLPSASATF